LGLDPGLASTGYGIIEGTGNRYRSIAYGTIDTVPEEPVGERLSRIQDELIAAIHAHEPCAAGIESIFFAKNSSSAIPVAQAVGVLLVTLQKEGIPVREFSPQAIKLSLSGHGRADKRQMQELVRILLALQEIPRPDHAADALAVAICCYNTVSAESRLKE
jgi:crossover junction endodeoxyribonuclease RuvC